MSKTYLVKLPVARQINMMETVYEVETDAEGYQIIDPETKLPKVKLDENKKPIPVIDPNTKLPKQKLAWVEHVSAARGLDMALTANAQAMLQSFDLFDVQDARRAIKDALDSKNRQTFDDLYIKLPEAQYKIILEAVKKHNWVIKAPDGNGGEQEVMFWVDWFEFFDAIRNPIEHNAENPDAGYATWILEKRSRVAREAEEDKKVLEAAAKKSEGASSESEAGGPSNG
jgi:hypothetical protein